MGIFFYYLLKLLKRSRSIANNYACSYLVTKSSKFVFSQSANVYNIQGDKSKILLGPNVKIEGELFIFGYGGQISIGENTYVGIDSRIWSGENIAIGSNVLISHQVNIIDSNSHEIDATDREIGYKNLLKYGHPSDKGSILTAPITIGDNVWISFGVTILKGVSIGTGSIIAAGSVVTKDVKPFTVMAGNPAREVNKLDKK